MLTTTVAGRTWSFSHAIGRNAGAGNGFTQPISVAVAPGGIAYVISRGQEGVGGVTADNKRIGKLTLDDEELLADFGRGQAVWPAGLAVDADGNLYCSDEHRNLIFVYDRDGEPIGQWGESGSGEGQLDGPSGLAFDSDDNLYVVDSRNCRVQLFTRDGRLLRAFGVSGAGDDGLDRPWGVTVDGQGDVYVADWGNDRVQKLAPDGAFLMSFGVADYDAGALDHPAGVAVDSEGDVYVTDWGNKRVQVYDPEGDVLTALYGDATEFSKWGRLAVDANPDGQKAYRRIKDRTPMGLFDRPVGIAVDERDRIIVADSTRGRLQVYVKESEYLEPQFNL